MRMGIGLGVGINRSNYAQGIFGAYATRVVADGGVVESGSCVDAVSSLLQSASLLLIPSGYKGGKLYSEIPTDGSGDLTFTRASNGTRVNSAGLVEVAPWNLVQYSEMFANAVWTAGNATITANTITAPNGTLTADTIASNISIGFEIRVRQTVVQNANTTYTLSCYAKKGTVNWFIVRNLAVNSTAGRAWFNLNTGTIGTVNSGLTASIENVGDGWYRCTISGVANGATNLIDLAPALSDGAINATSTGESVYIWGAQLNIGSTAKPYFPTTDRLNVPRLTYQNGGGGCPSLLLEKQSTNLALYSEQFDNAAWTTDGVTISANATTSPDGTQNADKIIGAASSGNKIIFQVNSITLGQPFTASAFFKKGEYKNAFLRVGGQTANPYVIYDLDTQSVVSTSGASSTQIESMGNGWYRISLTSLSATTTVIAPNVAFAPNSGYTISATNVLQYTGDGTSGGFAWGAQIEISSYKTSYIPTTSASATRVADACSKTGISSLIGQTEGVIFADINPEEFQTGSYIGITDGTITNRIIFGFESGSVNSGTLLVFGVSGINGGGTYTRGQRIKIALAYKSGNSALYVNGSLISTATTTFTASFSQFRFDSFGGTQNFIGKVNESILFPTRLTNAELASLTTI